MEYYARHKYVILPFVPTTNLGGYKYIILSEISYTEKGVYKLTREI